ncbi:MULTISPECIES: hypothetical protein [unclassified Streptomyces]|uniref:hypothetical protein n=1 Tax=unclassified Streptomyces TaxID=2593676 RepID=UPI002B1D433D|nr:MULTISPECIES: hypothetical protein [unclassified Streptomyces]
MTNPVISRMIPESEPASRSSSERDAPAPGETRSPRSAPVVTTRELPATFRRTSAATRASAPDAVRRATRSTRSPRPDSRTAVVSAKKTPAPGASTTAETR